MEVAEDIYCVHSEDVVVGCDGSGDPSGVGLYAEERSPRPTRKILRPLTSLNCGDNVSILSSKFRTSIPGSLFLVKCPPNCRRQSGSVIGAGIYSGASSICKAAIHSGYNSDDGAPFLVLSSHGQNKYYGSIQNGVQSAMGTASESSVLFAPMLADISSKVKTGMDSDEEKKLTRFGYFGESKLPVNFLEDRKNSLRKSSPLVSFLQLFKSSVSSITGNSEALSESEPSIVQTPKPLIAWCNSNVVKFRGRPRDLATMK
eukprot:Gregarina_sp_Poly_1__2420@NODE_164_length_12220_cov_166_864807_g146_i0_p4_GENE_NODE_164_length_12220_cov_166_864807_g146_i0NODE_164_length_12220_cov_166_864807_g146_i0_p4_ORF_typecomplete_len259_score30_32LCCL/PF03815_19/2_2e20_NODE_164_length_12220_cov_166_864807_g146_i01086811644